MRYLIVLFLLGVSSEAKVSKVDWELKQGSLTYHVHFPLKEVVGRSGGAKGKGHCEAGMCNFLIAVPLKTFDSGDGNRDNHMLQVTKAGLHPLVTVRVTVPQDIESGLIYAKAEVTFAGKTHTYDRLAITTKIEDGRSQTSGKVPLLLSDYGIERPSLLGVKIDDAAPVEFDLTWN